MEAARRVAGRCGRPEAVRLRGHAAAAGMAGATPDADGLPRVDVLRSAHCSKLGHSHSTNDTIEMSAGTYTCPAKPPHHQGQRLADVRGGGSGPAVGHGDDANSMSRVIDITGAVPVTFQNLQITGGLCRDNGVTTPSPAYGGGIFDTGGGALTIDNTVVTGNEAVG